MPEQSIIAWLRRRAENVMVLLLSVMFATFIVQIFARYILNRPVGWSEEVIIATWLWTVLWGAAFVVRDSEEIRFDILHSNISARARRILSIFTGAALVMLYAISLPGAWSYVSFMKVERSAYLRVPLNWLYSIYVIFLVACILRYCWIVIAALKTSVASDVDH